MPTLVAPDHRALESLPAAAALAASSTHPYARAIVAAASANKNQIVPADDAEEVPGYGMKRGAGDAEQRLGSADWVGVGKEVAAHRGAASLWFRDGLSDPVGFVFEDALRDDAADVVARLRAAGYGVELLSGDRTAAVAQAARQSAISDWRAQQKPKDKIARLESLKAQGHKVVMVGDGLNDAPALAGAHASLSPSSATEISQTAADAIFQGEHLAPIIEVLSVASASRRMALQNFAIAAGYNAVFVPLAMLGVVTPLIAAIAMSASSIAVTANAIRLRGKKISLQAAA